MPFEQPKFELAPERAPEPEKETGIERKRRLCKEAEQTIALPIFRDLKKEGVLSYAEHASEKADKERGVDFIWGLEDKSHLGIQFSVACREIWEKKIGQIIGEMMGKPLEELKDIHPNSEVLSRRERIERVPKMPLRLDWETVDNIYKRFEKSNKKGTPFDFLPEKREIEKDMLSQALENLSVLSSTKEIARRFPELPSLVRQRYETLNKSYLEFLKKEVK